jgi:GntR family transcriptional regulator
MSGESTLVTESPIISGPRPSPPRGTEPRLPLRDTGGPTAPRDTGGPAAPRDTAAPRRPDDRADPHHGADLAGPAPTGRSRTARRTSAPSTPKYVVIADELRVQIMSGAIPPGARLPGENELIRRHEVARMTARQALAVLQSEGLTVARRGAGVFVRDFRPIRRRMVDAPRQPGTDRPVDDPLLPGAGTGGRTAIPASPVTWPVSSPFPTRDDGRDYGVDQIEVHLDAASPVVAAALGVAPGTMMWVRDRRLNLDRKPVALAASYLPAEIVDGTPVTQPDPGPGGVYARLAELGHAPARFTEELRARMPLRVEASDLKLPAGTAVIVLCRTAFDAAGRPVEFTKLTLDADAHVLEYTIDTA